MVVHLLEVLIGQVILIVAIVLLKDGCNFLLALAAVGLRVHRFHELDEADASSLLGIKLCNYLICGLSVGIEAVLSEEQLDIIRQEHSHSSRIVSIEDFLEVHDVLI